MSDPNRVGQLTIILRSGGFMPLAMTKECAYATVQDWKDYLASGRSKFFAKFGGASDWGVLSSEIVGMYFTPEIPNSAARLAEAQTKIADAIAKDYGHGEEWRGD